MSIWGPIIETESTPTAGEDADLSAYVKKTGARMVGRINMGGKKITGLMDPTEPQDAATMGSVTSLTSWLNDRKVSKDGDSMTGELAMSGNRVTGLGTPTDNEDAVTKEYVDQQIGHEHDTSLHVLGRFMVWMNEDGTHYVSIRAKKNIDLEGDKLVEIKNGMNNTFNARPMQIGITAGFTNLPNPGKDLTPMRLTRPLEIFFNNPHFIAQPWNLSFSVKSGVNPPNAPANACSLTFQSNRNLFMYLNITWADDSISFKVLDNARQTLFSASVQTDTTIMHHVSIEYVENKLCFWINGVSADVYRTQALVSLLGINMNFEQLGILSFYEKNLTKQEIIQHFVENHISNFTEHEVLLD